MSNFTIDGDTAHYPGDLKLPEAPKRTAEGLKVTLEDGTVETLAGVTHLKAEGIIVLRDKFTFENGELEVAPPNGGIQVNVSVSTERSPEPVRNLQINEGLIRDLAQLQQEKNDGKGVSCIQTMLYYLRMGDISSAKAVALNEADKIRNYPDIIKVLEDRLFIGEQSPWKS